MTQTIDQTLAERGARYGEFVDHAAVTQAIKEAMARGDNWEHGLDCDQKECLEMVAHKLGRILNGDPDYVDSWTDIIGYTRLVEKRLIDEQAEPKLTAVTLAAALSAAIEMAQAVTLAAALSAAIELAQTVANKDDECLDPTCVEHHPEVAKAIAMLIKAGVIKQVD